MTRANPVDLTNHEWAWLLDRLDRGGECWLWQGMKTQGYGRMRVKRADASPSVAVHRLVYERLIGPIPDGYEIDHLCRVTHCARPSHLEAVTGHTNNMRSKSPAALRAQQETCLSGHPLEGDNLYVHPKRGTRDCRTCRRERQSKFMASNPTYKADYRARRRAGS